MCGSRGLTRFALTCIKHLSGLAVAGLIIVDPSQPKRSGWKQKLKKAVRLDGNLWHLQNRLFPVAGIPAYRVKPLTECMPGVPQIECTITRKGKWSEYFSPDDIARIREYQLDFVLKFGYGIIRGDIFSVARHGVWSYHHGDEEKYRGGPPAFWEIYRRDPVTGALLQRINETLDGGVVLKKISVPTEGLSHTANLQRITESSAHMVRCVCVDLLHGKADYLDAAPSKTQAPIYRAPSDLQMLRFWSRLAANWFRYKLANQRVDRWNVGLVHAAPEEFLKGDFYPHVAWSAYDEKNQMIADPFLISGPGGMRILCEEFDWFSEKGRILEIRPDSNGSLCLGTAAIEEDVHMSYPYVVEHQGETYCIPESADRGPLEHPPWRRQKNPGGNCLRIRATEPGRVAGSAPVVYWPYGALAARQNRRFGSLTKGSWLSKWDEAGIVEGRSCDVAVGTVAGSIPDAGVCGGPRMRERDPGRPSLTGRRCASGSV